MNVALLLVGKSAGLDELQAGNVVQITFVLGLMLVWTATYVFRVGNKDMTYVKQLKDYEDAVMKVSVVILFICVILSINLRPGHSRNDWKSSQRQS